MGEMGDMYAYRNLIGKLEGKKSLVSPSCRAEHTIKMYLTHIGRWGGHEGVEAWRGFI
jgi:hypothetical protein